jgi:TolA-binding protein
MKKRVSRIRDFKLLVLLVVLGVVGLLGTHQMANAQDHSKATSRSRRSFEKRLEQYLNHKSQQFVNEISISEQALVQFDKNVQSALKKRGDSKRWLSAIDSPESLPTTHRPDLGLLNDFTAEIAQLLELATQAAYLERAADENGDTESYEELAALRDRIAIILEDEQLQNASNESQAELAPTSGEAYERRNAALTLRMRLDKMAKSARSSGDRKLLENIAEKVNSLSRALRDSNDQQDHVIANSYLNEVNLLLDIIDEIETLKESANQQDLDVSRNLSNLRETIMAGLESTALAMMTYRASLSTGPTVSDVYSQWKAAEYAKYQIRHTRYQIRKNWLLSNATMAERDAMVEKDLRVSFSNFIAGNYKVAKKQFDWILQDYGSDFSDVESVLYYRGESQYQLQHHTQATRDYETIVSSYPNSEYFGDSLYRLLLISERTDSKNQFAKYYQMLNPNNSGIDQETVDKCRYLAAYKNTRDGNYTEAEEILSSIGSESKYATSASFLLGMVRLNQNNYASAIEIFKQLIDYEGEGPADATGTNVRNDAMLKLGFLYYHHGDYQEALKYFDRVTASHFDRDQSILGSAWANFKVGELEKATEKVDFILREELVSRYTYEALVLSAHCKRLLSQDASALSDLRYVANSRRVSQLATEYNRERQAVVNQSVRLQQIEAEILEKRDHRLYEMTAELRSDIDAALARFPYQGSSGTVVLEEFQTERQTIVKQIGHLDGIVSETATLGDVESMEKAILQRDRLMRSLDTYTADADVKNVNSFLDYPLATKGGTEKFRIGILRDLQGELKNENERISNSAEQAQALQNYYKRNSLNDLSAKLDLELLNQDLTALRNQSDQLHTTISTTETADIDTDFDRWAEFSGFGMSDHTYNSYKAKEAEITQLAQNFNTITGFLEAHKKELERKVFKIEKDVRALELEMKRESLAAQKKLRDEYFRDSYFDTKQREAKEN